MKLGIFCVMPEQYFVEGRGDMKLGIVGTGTIVEEVLPQLSGWNWQVSALCGTPRSQGKVTELCGQYEIPSAYTDYAAMLREAEMDAVYVAVPNFLHYAFVRQALEAGRHVIVEKPMTSNYREAVELSAIAREKKLFLFEAITTLYLPNYQKLRELLPRVGTVKLVSCNFSQYSRRYDAFRSGTILPAFDPEKSGGALMDLNLYNLHWILGLFGAPQSAVYQPNMERGIDTSGILTMAYPGFQAVSIAAKDCAAPWSYVIQGTDGYLKQDTPANFCGPVTLHLNDGTEERFDGNPSSRMEPEFRMFADCMANGDYGYCEMALERSLLVSKTQTEARINAGILFPADRNK